MEALDRRVAELRLEALVERDDVGVGIALRGRAAPEIAREGLGRHRGDGREARRGREERAARRVRKLAPRRGLGEVLEAVKLNPHGNASLQSLSGEEHAAPAGAGYRGGYATPLGDTPRRLIEFPSRQESNGP